MSTAVQKFIEEVIIHFPRREASEVDEMAWARSMKRNLEGFTPEVLARAAEIIIATCDRRDFQWLPKQCKEACFEAQKVLRAEKPRLIGSSPLAKGAATFEEKEKLAMELILGPLGRRAAKEGWIHSLFTWTRDHMRLPESEGDIKWCQKAAKGFDKELDRCLGALPGSMNAKLVPLGMSMLKKRQDLAHYVETGVLP